jgi:hypothetical protein
VAEEAVVGLAIDIIIVPMAGRHESIIVVGMLNDVDGTAVSGGRQKDFKFVLSVGLVPVLSVRVVLTVGSLYKYCSLRIGYLASWLKVLVGFVVGWWVVGWWAMDFIINIYGILELAPAGLLYSILWSGTESETENPR